MNLVKRHGGGGPPLARFQEEMNDLLREVFDDWCWGRFGLASSHRGWWPSADVSEHDDRITVRIELPGVRSEDVGVSIHGNLLTVSGEKKEEREDKGEGRYHSERRYGAFRRDIHLPSGVDTDKVEATCRDGVLTVTLPKADQAIAKRIEVKS